MSNEALSAPPLSARDNETEPTNPDALPKATREFALDRVEILLAAYGTVRPDNPTLYVENLVQTLTEFPEVVVEFCTAPRTGIQARIKFIPKIAEVRSACEAHMQSLRSSYEWAMAPRRAAERLDQERAEAAQRVERPTRDDLLKKYGKNGNWGIGATDPERVALQRKLEARDRQSNERFILREYRLHNLKPVRWNGMLLSLSNAKAFESIGKLKLENSSG